MVRHPTAEQLQEYIQGNLEDLLLVEISDHLDTCRDCQSTLDRLEPKPDTLVASLRDEVAFDPYAGEVELKRLIERLESDSIHDEPAEQGRLDLGSNSGEMPDLSSRDYQVLKRIQRGGMGDVYLARHVRLGRLVALKLMRPERSEDSESIQRFLREMKAVGGLSHPNIVQAFDAGEIQGQHFLAMELVDGLDLASLQEKQTWIGVADACEIIRQGAQGLEHAFGHGMVHRDIKPSNLMLTRKGIVKLLDLGLARIRNDAGMSISIESKSKDPNSGGTGTDSVQAANTSETSLTMDGQIMGTLEYMAPEQCTDTRAVDIRADIYGLGATLYRLLTGRAPCATDRKQTVRDRVALLLQNSIPDVCGLSPRVPRALGDLIHRMLARNPDDRFATPTELISALHPWTQGADLMGLIESALSTGTDHRERALAALPNRHGLDPNLGARRNANGQTWLLASSLAVLCLGLGLLGAYFSGSTSGRIVAEKEPRDTKIAQATAASSPEANKFEDTPQIPADEIGQTDQADQKVAGTEKEMEDPPARPILRAATKYAAILAIKDLSWVEANPPTYKSEDRYVYRQYQAFQALRPYAVMDRIASQVYFDSWPTSPSEAGQIVNARMAIGVDEPQDCEGVVYLPNEQGTFLTGFRFRVEAKEFRSELTTSLMRMKRDHYQKLIDDRLPGSNWFRYQRDLVVEALNELPPEETTTGNRRSPRINEENRIDQTMDFVSGNTAVGENLNLRDIERFRPESDELVSVQSLPGVRLREFNWTAYPLEEKALDRLASSIPEDQHAIFFPSFSSMIEAVDRIRKEGETILWYTEGRAEDSGTQQLYERQLGLPLGELARKIGAQFVDQIALTGGDLYFRTGTDVAVLFAPKDIDTLSTLLSAQRALSASEVANVRRVEGSIDGIEYQGFVDESRSMCSYQARLGPVLVVTNSLTQLSRLVEVQAGKTPGLSSLKEYRAMRHRYPMGVDHETAFVHISDPTLRRWASARWRIGTSRRTMEVNKIAALNAKVIHWRSMGVEPTREELQSTGKPLSTEYLLDTHGVRHKTFGSSEFQTPIAELDLDQVTVSEAKSYQRWLATYQGQWTRFFDPISIQVRFGEKSFQSDVSVVPLTRNSEYSFLRDLTEGSKLDAAHVQASRGKLGHVAVALQGKSNAIQSMLSVVRPRGSESSLYQAFFPTLVLRLDDDEFWSRLANQSDAGDYMEENFLDVPLSFHFAIRDPAKTLILLAALRQFTEGVGGDLLRWSTREHSGKSYTKIEIKNWNRGRLAGDYRPFLNYGVLGDRLVFSFSELAFQGMIDRLDAVAKSDGEERDLLGENLDVELSAAFFKAMAPFYAQESKRQTRILAWRNLPILNELKRLYPDQDPVAVYERYWRRALLPTRSASFRWDAEHQTMEDSAVGSPARLGDIQGGYDPWDNLQRLRGGMTFRDESLRAKVQIEFLK